VLDDVHQPINSGHCSNQRMRTRSTHGPGGVNQVGTYRGLQNKSWHRHRLFLVPSRICRL
jgi:hypothetical protein